MNFIKNIDKDILKKFGVIAGVIFLLFIVLIIFLAIKGSKLDYNQIEEKMISAAKRYYSDNDDKLPTTDNGTVSISADELATSGYMKNLSKLVKNKNDVCSGQVTVTKNGDYLLYTANLTCGDNYQTKKLKDVIAENAVTSGDGLYKMDEAYVFRGEKVNNYVSFADKVWRIIRINTDGTIRMIDTTKRDDYPWDDRYNSSQNTYVGINDYSLSRAKDSIEEIYNTEFTDTDKAYFVKYDLCVGKRSRETTINDATVECSAFIENQNLGLLTPNEYVLASLSDKCDMPESSECTNYNYMAYIGSTWTLTADKDTTYKVYKLSGVAFLTDASNYSQFKVVAHINSQVTYVSGDGTEENPYVFK